MTTQKTQLEDIQFLFTLAITTLEQKLSSHETKMEDLQQKKDFAQKDILAVSKKIIAHEGLGFNQTYRKSYKEDKKSKKMIIGYLKSLSVTEKMEEENVCKRLSKIIKMIGKL